MASSCMCSSVSLKVTRVMFHMRCCFQGLAPPMAAPAPRGSRAAAGTVQALQSLKQLRIPPLPGSRLCSAQVYGITWCWISHDSSRAI